VTLEEIECLLPCVFCGICTVVLAGRIRKAMTYARVDMNFMLLAEALKRIPKRLD
jgi:hypothetical protein